MNHKEDYSMDKHLLNFKLILSLDSGASQHIIYDNKYLRDINKLKIPTP